MGLTGLKFRYQQGCIPSQGSREECFPLFQLPAATHTPGFTAPSISKAGNGQLSLILPPLLLTPLCPSSSFKEPSDAFGPPK